MNLTFRQLPKINPAYKFVSWIVCWSDYSTSNPLTKKTAIKIHNQRVKDGKYSELLRCWTCVSAKNLEGDLYASNK